MQALIPSGGSFSLADPTPAVFQPNEFGFNVVQAAAPSGVSGTIGLSAPIVDIAGELSGLEAPLIETGPLGKDLCRVGAGSSLTPMGRGGLRPSATGLMRPDGPATRAVAGPAAGNPSLAPGFDPGFDPGQRVISGLTLARDCRY